MFCLSCMLNDRAKEVQPTSLDVQSLVFLKINCKSWVDISKSICFYYSLEIYILLKVCQYLFIFYWYLPLKCDMVYEIFVVPTLSYKFHFRADDCFRYKIRFCEHFAKKSVSSGWKFTGKYMTFCIFQFKILFFRKSSLKFVS